MTPSTIKRIASLCGVSRGTVDRVLNDRPGVSAGTAERVREVAERLGYQPNAVGRALVALRNPLHVGAVLSPDYNAFVAELRRGLAEAARAFAPLGVHIDVRPMLTLEAEEQVRILDELARDGVDAISLLPIESPEVARKVRELIRAGIPVVTFNSDLPEVERLCFVGQDHVAGGRVAGGLVGKLVRAGRVAVIASSGHLRCHVQRVAGFTAKVAEAYPEVDVAATVENEDRDDLAHAQALRLLREVTGLEAIYLTGGGAAGLGRALRETGRAGQVRVVTHDFVPATVQLLKDGVFDFAIGQDPVAQGYLPIEILHAFLTGKGAPPEPFVPTGIDIRTGDNVDEGARRAVSGAGPAASPRPGGREATAHRGGRRARAAGDGRARGCRGDSCRDPCDSISQDRPRGRRRESSRGGGAAPSR